MKLRQEMRLMMLTRWRSINKQVLSNMAGCLKPTHPTPLGCETDFAAKAARHTFGRFTDVSDSLKQIAGCTFHSLTWQVVLTVNGQRCAAVLTVVPEVGLSMIGNEP